MKRRSCGAVQPATSPAGAWPFDGTRWIGTGATGRDSACPFDDAVGPTVSRAVAGGGDTGAATLRAVSNAEAAGPADVGRATSGRADSARGERVAALWTLA